MTGINMKQYADSRGLIIVKKPKRKYAVSVDLACIIIALNYGKDNIWSLVTKTVHKQNPLVMFCLL